MRQHKFGRIENWRSEARQPILRPDTKIVRVARISGAVDEPEFSVQGELKLKAAVRDLLATFRRKISVSEQPGRFPKLIGDAAVVLSGPRPRRERRQARPRGSMPVPPGHYPC
jgi:hypothetical protein